MLFGYVSEDTLKFGASVSVASIMLGYFNTGILLFVGIFVTLMISSVITSAQDGQPMGQKVNTYVMLRIVGGIGLLAPANASLGGGAGYSICQMLVMKAIVYGVGFIRYA